jgi:hypothetical protein
MPQFHETRMGVRFFESQLPQLIKALEALAPKPGPDPIDEVRQPRSNAVLWRRGLVAKDGLLYQDGRMLSAREGDAAAHEYGLAYAEQLIKRLTDQPAPAVHERPVQAVLKQIPHLSFEERCVLFEAITRGYCQNCGRPLKGTPMEAQCECHSWIAAMNVGFKSLNAGQRSQLLRVLNDSWCGKCGLRKCDETTAKLEPDAACKCKPQLLSRSAEVDRILQALLRRIKGTNIGDQLTDEELERRAIAVSAHLKSTATNKQDDEWEDRRES